ncbi:phosphatidate cytidylyltransferase [Candidatus Pandoraea novymonadis]|uniref:Phosphatidate cytidylyltransferase n=1 Tax=Candidatus Pandoraea novymonadis TaxID=1808959 RepID=A0ABX5FE85_9BURK|nr:phosphatidate cytidylyltransferase [Candidatus Pandoraea novymonadis]PSB92030.1 Phosphatidate cytidylyltransferase [Candidatus Pandoraea novymonadis]
MLKTRVITTIVLFLISLPIIFLGTKENFFLFGAVVVIAGGWEWGRLIALKKFCTALYVTLITAGITFTWTSNLTLSHIWIRPAVLFWTFAGLYALARKPRNTGLWHVLLFISGPVVLIGTWQALCLAREKGVIFLLSVLIIVWIADTGAYFSGRSFGRYKLAPSISPGKSWEGAIGGWLLVLIVAALSLKCGITAPTIFTHLRDTVGLINGVFLLTLLIFFSVVGDLFESNLKRQAGVKDSGKLLPGHGGVLDRFDALLPVLPLAMAFI